MSCRLDIYDASDSDTIQYYVLLEVCKELNKTQIRYLHKESSTEQYRSFRGGFLVYISN